MKTASGLEIVAMACVIGVVVANVIVAAYSLGGWIVNGIIMFAEATK
jgi:hypothetical protein